MTEQDASVNYSVKELISRVDAKLDAYSLMLQTKADRTEVASLTDRVSVLEATEHTRGGIRSNWRVLGGCFAFLVSNGALWAAVLHK